MKWYFSELITEKVLFKILEALLTYYYLGKKYSIIWNYISTTLYCPQSLKYCLLFICNLILECYCHKVEWKSSPSKGRNFKNLLLITTITLRNMSWKHCSNLISKQHCHKDVNCMSKYYREYFSNNFDHSSNFFIVYFKVNYKNFILTIFENILKLTKTIY